MNKKNLFKNNFKIYIKMIYEDLQILGELIYRWEKHRNILKYLEDTNTNKKKLKIWSEQIEELFKSKIKSKL